MSSRLVKPMTMMPLFSRTPSISTRIAFKVCSCPLLPARFRLPPTASISSMTMIWILSGFLKVFYSFSPHVASTGSSHTHQHLLEIRTGCEMDFSIQLVSKYARQQGFSNTREKNNPKAPWHFGTEQVIKLSAFLPADDAFHMPDSLVAAGNIVEGELFFASGKRLEVFSCENYPAPLWNQALCQPPAQSPERRENASMITAGTTIGPKVLSIAQWSGGGSTALNETCAFHARLSQGLNT